MLCKNCGLALHGGDEAALFLCTNCGIAYEQGEEGLSGFPLLTAAVTTELAVGADVRYLATWRLRVSVTAGTGSAWERICRGAAPRLPYLYVPAFSLMRPVVQRLGVRLTDAQPELELVSGLGEAAIHRPALVGISQTASGTPDDAADGPDFGTFSPVMVGRKDAHILVHFVYLAVESHETRDLRSVDYELHTEGEDLVLIPAVWDPRHIHESNWRLLLREFDGLVA